MDEMTLLRRLRSGIPAAGGHPRGRGGLHFADNGRGSEPADRHASRRRAPHHSAAAPLPPSASRRPRLAAARRSRLRLAAE